MDSVRTAAARTVAVRTATALLVDDDAASRPANQQRLEDDGYTVVLAQNRTEALGRARQSAPNVIFIHLVAAGDGVALIEALRKDDACRHVPVVMLTAHTSRARERKLRPVGRDRW